ncbi:MAG TPA: hypothetical protein DCQ08_02560 [Amoebophilaceae bacterium]|nr:hypothetical protein [Amoebophilaceae bacterium]
MLIFLRLTPIHIHADKRDPVAAYSRYFFAFGKLNQISSGQENILSLVYTQMGISTIFKTRAHFSRYFFQ